MSELFESYQTETAQADQKRVSGRFEISFPITAERDFLAATDSIRAVVQAVKDAGGRITGDIVFGRQKFPVA